MNKLLSKKNISLKYGQMDLLFFAYFAVILTHSSVPYLKIILLLSCVVMTIINILVLGINKIAKKNILMSMFWYVLFIIYVLFSQFWSYSQRPESDIIDNLIRIFPIVFCISYYLTSKIRCLKMLEIIVKAITYFAVVFLLSSPIDTWGTIRMGGITSQWRNFSGHICAIAAIIAFIYGYYLKRKHYYFYSFICFSTTILTGSRGALLSLVFMSVVLVLLESNLSKRIVFIFLIGIVLFLCIYLLFKNEYLNQMYGNRLLAIFSKKYSDGSASDRAMYISVGLEMFKQKPVFGWGMDNFAYYLGNIAGYYKEVYSHCNYIEILSCYGLIGFILYYSIYLRKFCCALIIRKEDSSNVLIKVVIVILLRFFVFEFSTITFSVYLYVYILTTLFCIVNVLNSTINMGSDKNKTKNIFS